MHAILLLKFADSACSFTKTTLNSLPSHLIVGDFNGGSDRSE